MCTYVGTGELPHSPVDLAGSFEWGMTKLSHRLCVNDGGGVMNRSDSDNAWRTHEISGNQTKHDARQRKCWPLCCASDSSWHTEKATCIQNVYSSKMAIMVTKNSFHYKLISQFGSSYFPNIGYIFKLPFLSNQLSKTQWLFIYNPISSICFFFLY